jgi:hypothetical protein
MNNLYVSYCLETPKPTGAIEATVERLGDTLQLHASLWYLRSGHSASEIAEAIWPLMDPHDRLVVIDSSNDATACSTSIRPSPKGSTRFAGPNPNDAVGGRRAQANRRC